MTFDEFVATSGEQLRRALVARHGLDEGCDLASEALGYAWEHWARIAVMDNPVGYLYRVAENAGKRRVRWRRSAPFPIEDTVDPAMPVDVAVPRALGRLNHSQRTCVVLVHVFGWSYADTASVLDIPVSSVRNHVHRGLRSLRGLLQEEEHHG